MISKAEVLAIEDRLAGSGEMGGGDAPQPFFIPILDRIYDKGSITLAEATDTAHVTSERKRIERLWKDYGGFPGFIRGLLDVIEYRELAVKDDAADVWRRGAKMVDGEKVRVLPPLKGTNDPGVSYTARTAEERQRLDAVSKTRGDVASALAKLRPDSQGIRKIDPKNVGAIIKSVQDHGLQDDIKFKIALDEDGRVLGGRHRLEAAKQLGMEWPTRVIIGLDEQEKIDFAIADNAGSGWSDKDHARFEKDGLEGGKAMRLRDGITKLLLENHKRSNQEIAKIAWCSENAVAAVRHQLEGRGQIEIWRTAVGPPPKRGGSSQSLKEDIAAAMLANPEQSLREIASVIGCSPQTVSNIVHNAAEKAPAPVPENIKQALVDNPTLNHAAIARKIGERPQRVAQCCARLIADGGYDVCRHHLLESGALVHQTRQGGRNSARAPVLVSAAAPPPIILPADGETHLLRARIAELEAELAAANARIKELEALYGAPQQKGARK
jgi:DNA-binding CsgD family transcriptional regulator